MLSLVRAFGVVGLVEEFDQANKPGRRAPEFEFLFSHEGKKAETRCMTGRLASPLRPDPPCLVLLSPSSPGGGITETSGRERVRRLEEERDGEEATLLLLLWTLVVLLAIELVEGLLVQVEVEAEVVKVVAVVVEIEEDEEEWMCLLGALLEMELPPMLVLQVC